MTPTIPGNMAAPTVGATDVSCTNAVINWVAFSTITLAGGINPKNYNL
jgi:hypothetical protein